MNAQERCQDCDAIRREKSWSVGVKCAKHQAEEKLLLAIFRFARSESPLSELKAAIETFRASSLPQATPGDLQLFKSLADKVEDGEVSIDSLCNGPDKTARGWMGSRGQFDAGDNDEEALPQAMPQDAPEHLPENRYKSTVGRD